MSNYNPYHDASVEISPSSSAGRQHDMSYSNYNERQQIVSYPASFSPSNSSHSCSPPIAPYPNDFAYVPVNDRSYHQPVTGFSESGMEPLDLSTKPSKVKSVSPSPRTSPYPKPNSPNRYSPLSSTVSLVYHQDQRPSPTFSSPGSGQPNYYETPRSIPTQEPSFQELTTSNVVLSGMLTSNSISRPYYDDGSESDVTMSNQTLEAPPRSFEPNQDEEAPTFTNLEVSTTNQLVSRSNTTEMYCVDSRNSSLPYSSFSSYHNKDNAKSSPHYHGAIEETNSGIRTQHQAPRECSPSFQDCRPSSRTTYPTSTKLRDYMKSPARPIPQGKPGRSRSHPPVPSFSCKKLQQSDPDSSSDSSQLAPGVAPSAVPANPHSASGRNQSPPQMAQPVTPPKTTGRTVSNTNKENSSYHKVTQVPTNKLFFDLAPHLTNSALGDILRNAFFVADTCRANETSRKAAASAASQKKLMRFELQHILNLVVEEGLKA